MSVDKYMFWAQIGTVVDKLEDLDDYKESIWANNFAFKENLESDIKLFDKLLGGK